MTAEIVRHEPAAVSIPGYLMDLYWWAYVHPLGVRLFERQWLVNLILCGNYARLRNAALEGLENDLRGRTLQIGCAYGDLTPRVVGHMARAGSLDVVDVLPIQLENLRRKLPAAARVNLILGNSAALDSPAAGYDRVLIFFLLHEQPSAVRRATLAEAIRVLKPGGSLIVVDYHQPSEWHPLKPLLRRVLGRLEPYALDLWRDDLLSWLPAGSAERATKQTYFGGLYQRIVLQV